MNVLRFSDLAAAGKAAGKRVFIRADLNVPQDDQGRITEDTRIRASLPCIRMALDAGAAVMVTSHLGRPTEGQFRSEDSLAPVAAHLAGLLGRAVRLERDWVDGVAVAPGEVVLLENCRLNKGEKKNDDALARKLAALCDIYVNDAFGTAHRAHASTAVIAKFFTPANRMFGLLMEGEVISAEKVLHGAEKPFTAIIGGAKVSDKILIIENLLQRATDIIIGGGMAYTFMKARGGKIGSSLCEDDRLQTALDILEQAKQKNVSIHLPEDSVIADKFAADANTNTCPSDAIPDGWMGLDIGPKATGIFNEVIGKSKTVLWNGPMGVFEMDKFQAGTKAVAESVAAATAQGAFSLVGGGDSVAAVNKFGLAEKVSYVSTGGGAMLEYFEGKSLPGIAAIKE